MRLSAAVFALLTPGILLALTSCECCRSHPPQKYALLISTERADVLPRSDNTDQDPNQRNNSEFWSDLVLTYCTLSKNGFDAKNIFVLYGDGNDHETDLPTYRAPYCDCSTKITDVPLTNKEGRIVKDNICGVLCCMAAGRPSRQVDGKCVCSPGTEGDGDFTCSSFNIPRLTKEDFLFVWLKGHGAASGRRVYLQLQDEISLTDVELKGLTAKLAPRGQAWIFETCASGGWLDEFSAGRLDNICRTGNVALTASGNPEATTEWSEPSYPSYYPEAGGPAYTQPSEVLHGRFTYWINAALRREELIGTALASDHDDNNLVSILEAYDAATAQISAENQAYLTAVSTGEVGGEQHPGISTRGGIAPCAFIGLPGPRWYCQCFRHIPGP